MAGRNTLVLIRSLVGFGLGRVSLSLSLSAEMYGERAWQSSLLRSGLLDRRQGNAATAGATALLRYHYPQRCASERASEGRGVSPPGGPLGTRPAAHVLLRAPWTGR